MVGALTDLPVLTLLIAIPLVAGLLCLMVKADGARWIALIATLLDLALGAAMWAAYDPAGAQWQFVERLGIGAGMEWALGVDGIALMLIML